ncbi:Uncharacterized protein YijF [Pseudomonas syringae pv. actinidiae]|uniref:Uncharacterized protein YijF n=1 Tax=Pseudomonas syringae pv. actinidiae TaxID=103796 RepID=A0A2V0QZL6_PSESF|nr:Uncharacterized protein YijF [Pseudomonas syringae pv. actinidiae]
MITLLRGGINRTTGGTRIRTVGASQAALCEKSTLAAVVEQLERHVRTILTTRVQRQTKLNDVTTYRIDRQIKHVGLDVDEVFAG